MYDQYQDNSNIINENNRYRNQETEKLFNVFLNNNEKLTNSNENSKNTYKNLVNSASHKYKKKF